MDDAPDGLRGPNDHSSHGLSDHPRSKTPTKRAMINEQGLDSAPRRFGATRPSSAFKIPQEATSTPQTDDSILRREGLSSQMMYQQQTHARQRHPSRHLGPHQPITSQPSALPVHQEPPNQTQQQRAQKAASYQPLRSGIAPSQTQSARQNTTSSSQSLRWEDDFLQYPEPISKHTRPTGYTSPSTVVQNALAITRPDSQYRVAQQQATSPSPVGRKPAQATTPSKMRSISRSASKKLPIPTNSARGTPGAKAQGSSPNDFSPQDTRSGTMPTPQVNLPPQHGSKPEQTPNGYPTRAAQSSNPGLQQARPALQSGSNTIALPEEEDVIQERLGQVKADLWQEYRSQEGAATTIQQSELFRLTTSVELMKRGRAEATTGHIATLDPNEKEVFLSALEQSEKCFR